MIQFYEAEQSVYVIEQLQIGLNRFYSAMWTEALYSHKFKKQEIGTHEEQKINLTE